MYIISFSARSLSFLLGFASFALLYYVIYVVKHHPKDKPMVNRWGIELSETDVYLCMGVLIVAGINFFLIGLFL